MAKVIIDKYGTKKYLNDNGDLHRLDGPALLFSDDGDTFWWVDGTANTTHEPNFIPTRGGMRAWYYSGRQHRLNGPASDWPNGFKIWHDYDLRIWPKL